MNSNQALAELLQQIEFSKNSVNIGWESIRQWDDGTLKHFLDIGLLTTTTKAQSIKCTGCDYQCFKEVLFADKVQGKPDRAFIVCEVPEMQEQMGRISIANDKLKRWKSSDKHLARVVAKLLDIVDDVDTESDSTTIRLGMLKGSKGKRWISLVRSPLAIEVNQRQLTIADALFFEGNVLNVDIDWINHALNLAPLPQTKGYISTKDKREARKTETQEMYKDWKDECIKKMKKHPNKSDLWISGQIAKMEIAKGRSSETIRRNMKS